jgi:deoxyribonuclease-4
MSTSGGVWTALQRGRSIDCESVQIFVKNNMQWAGKPFSKETRDLFAKELKCGAFSCVFGHAGYLINLGAPPSPNRDRSIQSLIQEIQLASDLHLPFLVLHPGAHLGAGEKAGLSRIIAGLNEVLLKTRNSGVRIALENTAGQGTCLGNRFENLAHIFDRVKTPERLGICLDTAHLFAAGYDIRQQQGWEECIGLIESLIGIHSIVAFHLNDSKTDLGSRVDRHAHIGCGKLGKRAFRHIVNDPRFKTHPACLETPKGKDLKEDIENLARLRSLVVKGIKKAAPLRAA